MICLNDIIGVESGDTSKSGFYLEDTTAGRVPVNVAFYNDSSIKPNLVPEAVKEAIRELTIKSDDALLKQYTAIDSTIGFYDNFTDYIESTTDYYYLYLNPKYIKGGIARIKEINIYTINGKHTGDIDIYQDGEEVYNGTIAAYNSSPKTLDLTSPIFIAYQGDRPRDFKHSACCGSYPTHNGYVTVGSGSVSDLADLPERNDLPISDYCNGIQVKVNFDCDPYSFLCGLDFVRTKFGVVFAKLVQQIARKNIVYWVLTNSKKTSWSICTEDELKDILVYLLDDIETMLNFLPEAYDHSDCYICNGIYKGSILI